MFTLRLKQFAWALSATVDLVGVTDLLHGRRVAFIAGNLAHHLPAPLPWSLDDILLAGMLHDCGVSSTEIHEHLLQEMEWTQAETHCIRGAELLGATATLRHLAGAVRLHHQAWTDIRDPGNPSPDEWLGNLIFLADRIDVLAATLPEDILYGYPGIVTRLTALAPRLFNPAFAAALARSAKTEAFWLQREEAPLTRHFEPWIRDDFPVDLTWDEVGALFDLYGQCVDGKSRFTAWHSRAVGRLCFQLGTDLGLPEPVVQSLRLAGLVHDIGKLKVPDWILEYPDKLQEQDFSTIKHHSFDSLEILSHIEGFEQISEWASLHHERLDGSGYPYQARDSEVPQEARILAVADVFQALIQDRPYRRGMDPHRVSQILAREAAEGRLDSDIVFTVLASLDRYYALGQETA